MNPVVFLISTVMKQGISRHRYDYDNPNYCLNQKYCLNQNLGNLPDIFSYVCHNFSIVTYLDATVSLVEFPQAPHSSIIGFC